ncbi:MAG: hypothetical protein R3C14_38850 [Caldilineaceae bacterium]
MDLRRQQGAAAAEIILTHYAAEWTAWRCEQITAWVAKARQLVDALRPGLTLGLFAIPWQQHDFDGAIRTLIGQDFAALAPYVDIFSPMTYHRLCNRPVTWISEVVQELSQQTHRPICPIIQSIDEPTPLPATEYDAALELAATAPGANGVIVFTLAGMVTEEKQRVTVERWRC